MDALGLEPRTVRLLAKSAYASLASHAFGIEPDACHITKKRTSRHEAPTDSWKKREVDALGLEPRTVRLLAKSAYASLASHAFGIEPDAYHITKKRTSLQKTPTDSWKKEAKWTLWDSNPGPSGYEPDALTNWAKRPNYTSYLIIVKAIKNDP